MTYTQAVITTRNLGAVLFFILLGFFAQAYQAHATSEAEQLSYMGGQLDAMGGILSILAPRGEVLGASDSVVSKIEIESQIKKLLNQISTLKSDREKATHDGTASSTSDHSGKKVEKRATHLLKELTGLEMRRERITKRIIEIKALLKSINVSPAVKADTETEDVSGSGAVLGASTTAPIITVTAPNGGEKWSSGVLNTVTWTPYSYGPDINPARDVTAYLERNDGKGGEEGFTTIGKVQESGKASIHWITGELDSATQGGKYAPRGQYYIRVVNNVTGAWDRSDKPFTLLPKPISVKVNGSADWVSIPNVDQPITVSWTTQAGVSTCQLSGIKEVPFTTVQPRKGSVTGHIAYNSTVGGGISYGVSLQCVKDGTQIHEDAKFSVASIPSPSASLTIMSPNSGEQLPLNQKYMIRWHETGLKNVAIALYKNDKWMMWITKNDTSDKSSDDNYSFTWPINFTLGDTDYSDVISGNNIFKIYITGQKADGTGYIDDKSDVPFGFVSSLPIPKLGEYKGYFSTSATPFITTQNISRADALANCALNTKNNPTKKIWCTWKGAVIMGVVMGIKPVQAKLKIAEDDDAVNTARVIKVDATDDTNGIDVLSFTMAAGGSSDLHIKSLGIYVTVTGASNVDDLVNSFSLWIDGEEVGTGTSVEDADGSGVGAVETYLFDDLDYDLHAGDKVSAVIKGDFNSVADALDEGDTISFTIGEAQTDSEALTIIDDENGDALSDDEKTGNVASGPFTLLSAGITVDFVSGHATKTFVADAAGEKDQVTFDYVFDVTAFGNNMYIDKDVTAMRAPTALTDGSSWISTAASTAGAKTISNVISGGANSSDTATHFFVQEGDTRRFTISITLEASKDGIMQTKLTGIEWNMLGNADNAGGTTDQIFKSNMSNFVSDMVSANVI